MANYITLKFKGQINTSLQIGDRAYKTSVPTSHNGHDTTDQVSDSLNASSIKYIGEVSGISINTVTIEFSIVLKIPDDLIGSLNPDSGDFIFFSKDGRVNTASLLGYYGRFKFENNSTQKAELFSTTCNFAESSK